MDLTQDVSRFRHWLRAAPRVGFGTGSISLHFPLLADPIQQGDELGSVYRLNEMMVEA